MEEDTAIRRVETLVLGGGPAGAAVAIRLAAGGRPVELWERELLAGNRNAGDFLGAAALAHLGDLGIDPARLGAAPIERVRLLSGAGVADARLGFRGYGLSRRLLDGALLERAEQAGVLVRRGVEARAILPDGVAEAVRERVQATRLLLATGRGQQAVAGPGPTRNATGAAGSAAAGGWCGFRWIFRLAPAERAALAGHLELALRPWGRVLLHPLERDGASLSILVDERQWAVAGGGAEALLRLLAEEPFLAGRLQGAVPLLDRPLAVAAGGQPFRARPDRSRRAIWELGDVAAMLPGLPGDGIGLALHGACLASAAILTGADQQQYGRRLQRDLAPLFRFAPAAGLLARDPALQQRAAAALLLLPVLARAAFAVTRLRGKAVRRARLS